MNFRRLLLLKFFDDTSDEFSGPDWAKRLFLVLALFACISITAVVVSLLFEENEQIWSAMALSIVSFTLLCGVAWNFGLKGRAKNGLMTISIITAILVYLKNDW